MRWELVDQLLDLLGEGSLTHTAILSGMRADLRERREKTWELLVERGQAYTDVTAHIADEFGCVENTVETDIAKMEEWLPKLNVRISTKAISRMRELRRNRQRLHQMATQAMAQDDLKLELSIRKQLDRNIQRDVELSQSLGEAVDEPATHEFELTTSLSDAELELVDAVTSDAGKRNDVPASSDEMSDDESTPRPL